MVVGERGRLGGEPGGLLGCTGAVVRRCRGAGDHESQRVRQSSVPGLVGEACAQTLRRGRAGVVRAAEQMAAPAAQQGVQAVHPPGRLYATEPAAGDERVHSGDDGSGGRLVTRRCVRSGRGIRRGLVEPVRVPREGVGRQGEPGQGLQRGRQAASRCREPTRPLPVRSPGRSPVRVPLPGPGRAGASRSRSRPVGGAGRTSSPRRPRDGRAGVPFLVVGSRRRGRASCRGGRRGSPGVCGPVRAERSRPSPRRAGGPGRGAGHGPCGRLLDHRVRVGPAEPEGAHPGTARCSGCLLPFQRLAIDEQRAGCRHGSRGWGSRRRAWRG